jgi:alkanesulfonate monooxygenase SsuD/methylene tetrahydromethanopterin reductase-like flavin-dependent oxidoreductase (luciferase family)
MRLVDGPEASEPARDERYLRYLSRQNPVMVDTPEVVAEKIKGYVDAGVTHFILRFHFGDEIRNMRMFMDRVTKRL